MPFRIIRDDITRVKADAIVNTANPEPVCAGRTDYAVYTAAGMDELLAERQKIGKIGIGEAAVTPAFRLPAKFIIHTVGPFWVDGLHGEPEALASCCRRSLLLAKRLGCGSIALPLISAGVCGFPKDLALSVALNEIGAFLEESEMEVTLAVSDRSAFELSKELTDDVGRFIDGRCVKKLMEEEYAPDRQKGRPRRGKSIVLGSASAPVSEDEEPAEQGSGIGFPEAATGRSFNKPYAQRDGCSAPAASAHTGSGAPALKKGLSDLVEHPGESFQKRLLRLIDERGLKDAEVYKKANVDRKLFSKIRCSEEYLPGKRTAVALAIALRLSPEETADLLSRAGMALSPSSRFDLIVEYCIEHGIYDIFKVNALLFQYNQPMLGC